MSNVRILDRRDMLGKIVTAYGTVAKPLFLAGEVAGWLDISNVSQMLQNVDEDEKVKLKGCLSNSYTPGGENEHTERWFLTEYGLYEVLMQSRKPMARGFKKGIKQLLYDVRTGKGTMRSLSVDEFCFAATVMMRHHLAASKYG